MKGVERMGGLRAPRSAVVRYGGAVLVVLAAVAIKLLLDSVVQQASAFLLLSFAVLVAAVFGGFGAGVFATFLGAVLGDYFFLEPVRTFGTRDLGHTVLAGVFVAQGLAISAIAAKLAEVRRESEAALADTRKAEEMYRGIFENATEGIYRTTPDGRILAANPAMARIFGYRSPLELMESVSDMGREVWSDPERREEFVRLVRETGAVSGFEAAARRRDGTPIRVSVNAHAVRYSEAGEFLALEGTVEDVTGRRRGEEIGRRLAAIVQSSEDAIIGKTLDGVITDWNRAAQRIYGYTAEEVLGRHISILAPPDLSDDITGILRKLRWGESVSQHETVRVGKDGRMLDISLSVSPIKDAGGNILGAASIARDITARKRMERALAESEERYRVVAETASDGIVLIDEESRILFANSAVGETFGYATEELVGRNLTMLMPERMRPIHETSLRRYLATGERHVNWDSIEVPGLHRDGHEIPLEVSYGEFVKDGERFFTGFLRDISERKRAENALRRSEERYRTLFESIDEGFCLIEALFDEEGRPVDYRFLETNPAFERQTGLVDAPGHTARELVPDLEAFWVEVYGSVALTGEPTRFENGSEATGRWFDVYAFRVGGRESRRVAILFTDVTGRKRAEDELRRLNASLERRVVERTRQLTEANEELESFSYSVSHDLRAPLRHISGFAEMLRARAAPALDETSLRYLGVILESTERAGGLIDDLLAFSRVGRTEMRRSGVDTGHLVRRVVEDLKFEADDRAVEWRIGELPEVWGDPSMLRLVFENLISNALKYTRTREKAVIEVGSRENGDESVFFVRDNGVGFDEKYSEKLFGVFQRLHRQEEFEGTGIGLANVRRIVHRHGGRVWAEARPDEGATFSVSIPRTTKEDNRGE